MSSSKSIQPLFTRSPLILPPPTHSNQALFVTSPISASPPPPLDEENTKHRGLRYPSSAYTSTQSSPVFETLSFEKIKIPSSTTASTDSEAFSSDYASHSNLESRVQSPSLISCLFQSTSIVTSSNNNRKLSGPTSPHSRSSSRNGSTSNVGNGNGSKPILRRDTMSTSASEDNAGFGLGINRLPPTTQNQETIVSGPCTAAPVLKKKPSCLTFAISSPTPRSQSNAKAGPSRSSSTSVSPTSSYAGKLSRSPGMRPNWSKIRGQVEREIQEDDDEDDEEECMVDSPLPIPGHGESDEEDQGYVEDEEDGFTTDEDEEVDPRTDQLFGNGWDRKVEWNREYQLTTPKRRNTETLPGPTNYMTSTDDNSILPQNVISPRGRKTSICINTNTKPSSNRCTRHRSPPPPVRSSSTSLVSAPPAARSPSAADLCRRRGSVEQGLMNCSTKKGWRSDDSAFFPTQRPGMVKTNSFKLPSASSSGCTQASVSQGNRKASLPTPKLDGGRCSTRSILKSSCAGGPQTQKDELESQPMIRSSGENKIPPKTPPLTGDLIVPSSGNMLRRGSAPVIHETKDMLGAGVGRPGCLARSATGYEEEEMGYHHQQHRGIRIV